MRLKSECEVYRWCALRVVVVEFDCLAEPTESVKVISETLRPSRP